LVAGEKTMTGFRFAQVNVDTALHAMNDSRMKIFSDNLDRIDAPAEAA
jgi:hypothetical protein